MYRSVALAAVRDGIDSDDAEAVGALARRIEIGLDGDTVTLGGADVSTEIRSPEVSAAASVVAAHPQVREAMVEQQRALIDGGRYVAEGRDIGTVVSPEAPLKIFLVADVDERARRRARETGEEAEAVARAMGDRDARDSGRDHSPLQPAPDAIELDTTNLSIDEVAARVVELARERGLA
jgi:cytidylate kinase